MNSNQFFTLLQKGNDLQKEDFQQLVKLHASFPYFQIPAVLAAKYEYLHSRDGSNELLHKAAILSPDRTWLKSLIRDSIHFLEEDAVINDLTKGNSESPSIVIIDSQKEAELPDVENQDDVLIPSEVKEERNSEEENKEQTHSPTSENFKSDQEKPLETAPLSDHTNIIEQDNTELTSDESFDKKNPSEENFIKDLSTKSDLTEENYKEEEKPDIVSTSHPTEDTSHPLITSPSSGDEDTRPDLILPDSAQESKISKEEGDADEVKLSLEENDKSNIEPLASPPSSRQQILKQLEDNLARLKAESSKNKPEDNSDDEDQPTKPRRKRAGEDLIDSIKKKEKREIKDTKKKEQNDIIKAFNKKSIKLAAIKENEDVNKLQDLSLPSTKINDRMVSESYAKLLTQQGKKAAAKEIYKKLILKFPQKKAYFADLIQQLEE